MVAALLGPSLPDLAEQTSVRLKQVSLLFSSSYLGYMLGALVGGHLYDRRFGHPLMAFALLLMSVTVALAPLTSQLVLLALVILFVGISQGIMEVGGNTLIVWLHREKVGPFMIALHLFWGIGNIISPILIAQSRLITGSFALAFWVISGLLLPVAFFLTRYPGPTSPSQEEDPQSRKPVQWRLVILFMLFFLTFTGVEGAYGGWIYSYSINTGIATEVFAAYLTSAYWGALTFSRLISIPLSLRFRPLTLLIVDLIGCLVGLTIAVMGEGSPTMIWLATIILGASIGTMFPLGITYASEIITVTGQFTSLIIVGVSLGGMLIPWVIGQFFETTGPQTTMWILLGISILSTLIFAILVSLKNRVSLPHQSSS